MIKEHLSVKEALRTARSRLGSGHCDGKSVTVRAVKKLMNRRQTNRKFAAIVV